MRRIPVGLRYMAASALFFSGMVALVKAAGAGLPTMEIVFARSLVVLLLSAIMLRRGRHRFRGLEPRLLFARGALGFVALSCFYYGVVHLPLAEATVIQFTNPVFTALIAVPVLGEAMRVSEALLVLAGLFGVWLVARGPALAGSVGGGLDTVTVCIALLGAVFSASSYVLVRRLRREEPLVVVFYFALVSVVASLPLMWPGFVMPTSAESWVLLGVGVCTYLGQLFLTRGLQSERAGRATAIGYLQILFAAAWGALFFQEIPGIWTALGALVIILSTLQLARPRTVLPQGVVSIAEDDTPPLAPSGTKRR